ncbi:MAG: hypothetical protein ACLQU3_19015, partial [Limisphaerales bacterium]
YRVITGTGTTVMPPPGNPRLGETDVALVRDWIASGATKFPEDVAPPAADPAIKEPGLDAAGLLSSLRLVEPRPD